MKNLQPTCILFHSAMNNAAANTNTLTTRTNLQQTLKRTVVMFVCVATLLIGATSCARNTASGCGTWPAVKINKNQYRSDNWPIKAKNNSQFANYKRYN